MRLLGVPSAPTVDRTIALGSVTASPASSTSTSQRENWVIGSGARSDSVSPMSP